MLAHAGTLFMSLDDPLSYWTAVSLLLLNQQHLGVKVTAFPVCGLCCCPGLYGLQGEQECAPGAQ